MRLQDQVALVTGAAGGIGKAIALQLGSEGAQVVVADLQEQAAQAVARQIGGRSQAVQTDIADANSVQQTFQTVIAQSGRLDILVNNAAIHIQKLLVDLADEEWDSIQQVNARGTFLCARAAARQMLEQRSGTIINIITHLYGVAYSSAYIASKHAVWGLTQCLAVEMAPYGVRVNAVAPGAMLGTGMEKWYRAKAELAGIPWDEFTKFVVGTIPLGRWCTPEDVASAVAFLASSDAEYITGETLHVTGGWKGMGVPVRRRGKS